MVKISNLEEMSEFARQTARQVKAGDVLLLQGDLGTGKTTFTRALAKILGVKENVSSPTFTIMAEYEVKDNIHIKKLIHVDLYRIETIDETTLLFLNEIMSDAKKEKSLIIIEWPEKLGNQLPANARHIQFQYGAKENERIIDFNSVLIPPSLRIKLRRAQHPRPLS